MRMMRAFPASLSAAAITGWVGGAAAWAITSGWRDSSALLSSYDRIDQYVALTMGACIGACVLVGRARHRREPLLPAFGAGLLLGGVAALMGATYGLLWRSSESSLGFVFQRIATWTLLAAFAATALSMYSRHWHLRSSGESLVLGALGGAIAGLIFSLPGPADVWLPLAMTWCGGAIGLAAVGPAMWRAPVVVQLQPPRGRRHSLWSLHECAIENGWSMEWVEAQVGCVNDMVYVYPPPAGAVLDGYPLYRVLPLTRTAMLAVGRTRLRVTLRRSS